MTGSLETDLKERKKRLAECQTLVRIKRNQKKMRNKRKAALEKASIECPQLKNKMHVRDNPYRPRLEVDMPHLLMTIMDLALHGSAAHERRREDIIRTVRTLDDLGRQIT